MPPYSAFFPPQKNCFLNMSIIIMELNYSTWVQNRSHGANICFLHWSWENSALRDNGTSLFLGNVGI